MTVATVTAVVVAATAVPAGLGGFLWPLLTGFTGNRTDPSGGGFELNKRIIFHWQLSFREMAKVKEKGLK